MQIKKTFFFSCSPRHLALVFFSPLFFLSCVNCLYPVLLQKRKKDLFGTRAYCMMPSAQGFLILTYFFTNWQVGFFLKWSPLETCSKFPFFKENNLLFFFFLVQNVFRILFFSVLVQSVCKMFFCIFKSSFFCKKIFFFFIFTADHLQNVFFSV